MIANRYIERKCLLVIEHVVILAWKIDSCLQLALDVVLDSLHETESTHGYILNVKRMLLLFDQWSMAIISIIWTLSRGGGWGEGTPSLGCSGPLKNDVSLKLNRKRQRLAS